jgi:phage host-nuclease inhibitor protein Gam
MRKRIETSALQSWDDVDLHLKEIGELEIQIEQIEAQLNLKISDLKLEAADKVKSLKERIGLLELEMKEFVEANRADIQGKTMNLNFGDTGFRKSTKIIIRNIKNALAMLKALGMNDCIIVEEKVSKDELSKYSEDVIAKVGAKKQVQDTFWYETKRERLQEVAG